MASLASSVSSTHTHSGNSEITFTINDQNELSVTIDTQRLHIRSVQPTEEEYDRYAALYGNVTVMEKFATGETKTRDEMKTRINDVWVKRWHDRDPFSGMAVFIKGTEEFVGHVALGHGDLPGEAEFAGLGNVEFWQQGYGMEAAAAIVNEYAPAIIKEGFLLEGKPLTTLRATARPDNHGSVKIMERLGLSFEREEEKHGALRYHFSADFRRFHEQPSKKTSKRVCLVF